MRPPYIASAFLDLLGTLFAAAALCAVVVLLTLAVRVWRPVEADDTDVDAPLDRLSRFHIFGPDEDDESRVHVPVLRAPPAPAAAPTPAPTPAAALPSWRVRGTAASPAPHRPALKSAGPAVAPTATGPAAPARAPAKPARAHSNLLARPAPTRPAPPVVAKPAAGDLVAAVVHWNSQPPATTGAHPAPPPQPAAAHTRRRGDLPLDGDILLVEDDVALASLYQLLLGTTGYGVRHAHDGVEGITMVRARRPALILLDMMMPRMDGLQFLEALRGWPKTSAVPVVVLSNTDNENLVDRALALGAVEYLIKAQTRPQVLVGALPHWLRGNRALTPVS